MKLAVAFSALLGLAVVTLLIGYFGFGTVGQAFLSAGWGMVAIACYHMLALGCAAMAWRTLVQRTWQAPFLVYFWARWIRESVNGLMPVGQVGGDIVGARLLAIRGAGAAVAGAGAVVDKTVEVFSQFVFSLFGVALLLYVSAEKSLGWSVAIGLLIFAPLLVGFVVAQRMGMFRLLERFLLKLEGKSSWLSLGDVSGLHDKILELYGDRRALVRSFFFHLLTWVLGIGEVWLTAYFMGFELGLFEAAIIESLAQAVRSAGFVIPGSLGVQEGGYLLFGTMFGLSPEVALGLSLVRRVRQLLIGIPGLIAWQISEGQRLVVAQRRSSPPPD